MKDMDMFGSSNKKSTPAFGIDLGTTNSAISVIVSGNTPEIIRLKGGRATLPSCVMWMGGDKFIVGREAYMKRHQPNVCYSVKRKMGTGKMITLEFEGEKKKFTPAFISSLILKELATQASKAYGEVKDVVITIPAYFNQNQIKDTIEAGKLVGLNVMTTFSEPTSASLLYTSESQSSKILVYDLGGGTFDVSLVRIDNSSTKEEDVHFLSMYGLDEDNSEDKKSKYSVLAVEGDSHLGGDDVDNVLLNMFLDKLKAKGVAIQNLTAEQREMYKLSLESYKKENCTYDIFVEKIGDEEYGERVMMSTYDFMSATKVVYDKTKVILNRVLKKSDVSTLDGIVLVGGSTKSEYIRSMLKTDFPNLQINCALNPDESVALGSSIEAKRLKFGDDNIEIFDVLPMSIGVLADNKVMKLIGKNQSVPFSKTRRFATLLDDQESINIQVYQGDSMYKDECSYLGNLRITDIPKGKAGTVGVDVKLSISATGILNIKVITDSAEEDKELINIFTAEKSEVTTSISKEDKKYTRWKAYLDTLKSTEDKEVLQGLLDSYLETGKSKEVMDFIKTHKAEVEIVNKRYEIAEGTYEL